MGSSRPRLRRMRSISSVVAWSPAITAAGSPGPTRIMMKTMTATTIMTMAVEPSLRRMKLSMRLGAPGVRGAKPPVRSLLLDVPVDRHASLHHALDVRAEGDRLHVLAQVHIGHRDEGAGLDLIDHRAALGRVGFLRPGRDELGQLLV